MNHVTPFAALTYILAQNGAISQSFAMVEVDERRAINSATQYRTEIYVGLGQVEQKYITDYLEGGIVDATFDATFEVVIGGEAVAGAIWVIYSDQGDILKVFAMSY